MQGEHCGNRLVSKGGLQSTSCQEATISASLIHLDLLALAVAFVGLFLQDSAHLSMVLLWSELCFIVSDRPHAVD